MTAQPRTANPTGTPVGNSIWTRTFVAAMLLNFGICANFFLLVPVTVSLVQERFDASVALGGVAAGALLVGAVLARPFSGVLLQGRSERRASILCAVTMTASTAACLLPVPLAGFVGLRLVAGLAFAVSSTAAVTIAMGAVPPHRRGAATGWFGLSNSMPAAVGPALGLLLARTLGHDAVIWAVVATSAGAAAAALVVVERDASGDPTALPARGLRRLIEVRVLPVCLVIGLVGLGNGGLFSFVDSFSVELGAPDYAPLFFLAFSAALIAVRPLSGRAMDNGSPARVVAPALAMLGGGLACLSLFSQTPPLIPFLAVGLLCGSGMGMVLAAATVLAIQMAPPGRLAVTVSTYYLALDSAVGLGPVLLGALLPHVGFQWLFALMGAAAWLSLALFALFLRVGLLRPAASATTESGAPALDKISHDD